MVVVCLAEGLQVIWVVAVAAFGQWDHMVDFVVGESVASGPLAVRVGAELLGSDGLPSAVVAAGVGAAFPGLSAYTGLAFGRGAAAPGTYTGWCGWHQRPTRSVDFGWWRHFFPSNSGS